MLKNRLTNRCLLLYNVIFSSFMFLVANLIMTPTHAELIVLAAPRVNDAYYAGVEHAIFNFQITYAKKIIQSGDQVLVLSSAQLYPIYAKELGKRHVLIAPMLDIWARDFTMVNPNNPVLFRYTAAAQGDGKQGQIAADQVQDVFYTLAKQAGLTFKETDLLDDGGNFVEDGVGNVVLSTKFLNDNHLSVNAAREKLRRLTGAKHIAFIVADEQGGLEHADGIVSFIAPNTLVINDYKADPDYLSELREALKAGLPHVKLHQIIFAYKGKHIYDQRFGSACGLYTNMLVTKQRIYFPQFGIPADKVALRQLRGMTKKQIVLAPTAQVCDMGGGIRCLSWQLRGQNAKKLWQYAVRQRHLREQNN